MSTNKMKLIIFAIALMLLMLATPGFGLKHDAEVRQSECRCTPNALTNLEENQFFFHEKSTEIYFGRENAIKDDLSAFTLSFFVKMEKGGSGYQCVFSYATSESTYGNEIYVCLSPTILLNIGNTDRKTKVKIEDDQLHHVAVTWDSSNGNYHVYLDGKLADRNYNFQKGHVIPSGGTIVIGQDQDNLGGGFQDRDAFGPGVVGALNMWSTVLPDDDISEQSETCKIPNGSVTGMYKF